MKINRLNWLFWIGFIFCFWILSCNDNSYNDAHDNSAMGKFDSLMIAQEKGPTIEAFYENIVNHVSFQANDGVMVYGDIYEYEDSVLQILYCHQAGYSKGEYINTAIIMSQIGFSGMAIDLRSGGTINNIPNETAKDAYKKGKPSEYIDAKKDIEAAIDYLYACNGNNSIILVGSSYSASLCLLIAKDNYKVKAAIAFSPGEYLENLYLFEELEPLAIPVFVTSSKMEIQQTTKVVSKVDPSLVTHFKPKYEGIHGASALWKSTLGYKDYWEAMLDFIKMVLYTKDQPHKTSINSSAKIIETQEIIEEIDSSFSS